MNYRTLPPDEWNKLSSVFTRYGGKLPHPSAAIIIVAEEGGSIIGFVVLQVVNHLEPVWLDPQNKRARHALSTLVHMAEARIPNGGDYYAFSADDHVSDLCKAFGLEEMDHRCFKKEV
jgi:hypothetical protein